MKNMICDNLSVNEKDHLCLGGQDTVLLAEQYGTPLYLLDEDRIRLQCRTYLRAMREAFGEAALPLYASKAASFKQSYRIMQEEGMGIDVVSVGEIYTASLASFPLENAYFHSNNKTDEDIAYLRSKGLFHEQFLDYLRNLLKDKDYIALAYMTGILPIKKYGKHTRFLNVNEDLISLIHILNDLSIRPIFI